MTVLADGLDHNSQVDVLGIYCTAWEEMEVSSAKNRVCALFNVCSNAMSSHQTIKIIIKIR